MVLAIDGKAMPGRSARRWRCLSLIAAFAVLLAACEGEPPPTISAPPNPTSAPASTLAACLVKPGNPIPASPAAASQGNYTNAQAGVLSIGSVTSNPPFESVSNGTAVGFDIDLIAEVARRLGLEPEIVGETPSTLLTDVAHGRTDVAISAIDIIPTWEAVVDFTDPYFSADLALTVGVEHGRNFGGIGTLAGKTVGVDAGSYGQTCAKAVAAQPGKAFTVKAYTNMSQAFTDLSSGKIDAVLTDLPTSQRLVQAIDGLQMVEIYRTSDEYGIGVSKANPNLRIDINRILADLVSDGTYKLIYEKWFQVPPPSPAPTPAHSSAP